jgi:hypothetical protein
VGSRLLVKRFQFRTIRLLKTKKKHMNIKQVAKEILDDWKNPYFGAVPYLEAMLTMNDINENYYDDSGKSIVMYFLGNAQTWRGAKAKETKLLLNKLIK